MFIEDDWCEFAKKKKMLAAKAKKMGFFLKKMWIMENGNKKPGNNSAE